MRNGQTGRPLRGRPVRLKGEDRTARLRSTAPGRLLPADTAPALAGRPRCATPCCRPCGPRPEQARRSRRRVGGRSCARPLRAVRSRARLSQPRDGWRGARSPCAGWTPRCHYWAVKASSDGALACYTPPKQAKPGESADALVDRAFRLYWHGQAAEADNDARRARSRHWRSSPCHSSTPVRFDSSGDSRPDSFCGAQPVDPPLPLTVPVVFDHTLCSLASCTRATSPPRASARPTSLLLGVAGPPQAG
jgi:hypothetical protein